MEHEGSILYAPVNAIWHSVQHRWAWDIPDHVIMAALVLVVSCVLFPLATRRLSRDNPGPVQQILEHGAGVVATQAARRQRKEHARDDEHQRRHDHMVRNVPRPAMLDAVPDGVYGSVEN